MESIGYIRTKVENNQRISNEDANVLFASNDLTAIGAMADTVRRRMNATTTHYIVNRHINYTNLCKNSCSFCAYQRSNADDPLAFTLSMHDIKQKALEGL